MPIPEYLKNIVEEQEALCIALTDPEITEAAKHIAFYAAMIEAAKADPMDTEGEQTDALAHFHHNLTHWVERYQTLVNEAL